MVNRLGQQLGNYRLTRLLGQGGFAEVYLGEHVLLGTTIAIKVLHTQVASEDMAQFQQEARILASLKHPHIVRILDFGIEERTPYLMMDYAPNETLRTRHPKGTVLPIPTVVEYVKQIAQALQYAHEQKIVHRDIKPENMLISERNEILLSDFGIALVAQSSRYQSTQDMAGTMAYSAPEQIQGKPRLASDQYALGIVVYEWLSGDRPFHGSFTELVGQHLTVPPPPLRAKLPTISPDIEHVILTALAKRPEDRFDSVRTFSNALEQASQGNLSTERARSIPLSSPLSPSPEPQLMLVRNSAPITPIPPQSPIVPPGIQIAPRGPKVGYRNVWGLIVVAVLLLSLLSFIVVQNQRYNGSTGTSGSVQTNISTTQPTSTSVDFSSTTEPLRTDVPLGTYKGKINDNGTLANITITFLATNDPSTIRGIFTVEAPLYGSGPCEKAGKDATKVPGHRVPK